MLHERYLREGQGLEPVDATVKDDKGPLPPTFFLHDIWMFGCTKPTSEVTAVAQTPLCRYQLGLGIYNVQAAVDGMEGGKRSTYCLSVDNCCALYSFPVTFRVNLTAGSEVQPSPMQLNSMDMCWARSVQLRWRF